MATWNTVKEYLISNYKCDPFLGDGLKLTFDLGGGRSQLIFVHWAGPNAHDAAWVDFQTPIGRLGSFSLEKALARTSDFVVGGLSLQEDIVTLRSCVPLENLDRNEIDDPMRLLLNIADQLEAELTERDEF